MGPPVVSSSFQVSARVSSAVFRQLASGDEAHRSERLFRAAISAFASLVRPTRREIAQLDDLTRPLYDLVPVETRRYAAAMLCECGTLPPDLLGRLSAEPVEISAPLLVRSPALTDAQLIRLIAANGVAHARAIGRRAGLDPAIAALVRALISQSPSGRQPLPAPPALQASAIEEAVRRRLRSIMRAPRAGPGAQLGNPADPALLTAALSGDRSRFTETLAARLGLAAETMLSLLEDGSDGNLVTGLRALALGEAEAVLLCATQRPGQFTDRATISAFITRFRSIPVYAAQRQVRAWREGTLESKLGPAAGAVRHQSLATVK